MPTYHCLTPVGLLNAEKRTLIAKEITRIHNAVTGAATFFAQVVFTDVADGHYFVGGAPLVSKQIFVHGHIRAGRSVPDRQRLVTDLVNALSSAGNVAKSLVWVYVTEIPARQMAEYGHVLPEPGDESMWLKGLPAADREYMLNIGREPTMAK